MNSRTVKLNEFIFTDIIFYLTYRAYEESFKRILEISLISKNTFKIIQQIIVNQRDNLKRPICFNYKILSKLILDQGDSKFKLLQIQKIRVLYLIDLVYNRLERLPLSLDKYCASLEKRHTQFRSRRK
ncbi:hypothetical protein DICPUDRAFT_156088 [Dictyostelium purpureum]|uniref:Uncharacterized protein n=1 Tax=Dictyostelium purpureum TaxID=5786 RepID=F0ZVP0_DICPU|nr:uncharacterized protein DICPUDRAFT_156088 [Dictyostelium purpureum]EGC31980.1 hypothetical protein DICPUDRAFT_156088 [Dictyostelium purpureum]|eukprot:XP_003291478.1 hypothetical protein DICPUDRAFT_156088 [Dictyostelium purpureum]